MYDPTDRLRSLAVPRKTISSHMLLQEGTFGQIYRGTHCHTDTQEEVIVKTVSGIPVMNITNVLYFSVSFQQDAFLFSIKVNHLLYYG